MIKSRTQLLLLLLTTVVFSKEILVFNEEILVLFAFSIFVYMSYYFAGTMVSLELDNRSNKIKEEFDLYKNIQVQTLTHLISYHNKQKLLSEEINGILSLTKKDLDLIMSNHSLLLSKSINTDIDEKLKKIVVNNTKTALVLQSKINDQLYAFLLSSYSNVKDKNTSLLLLNNSISFLIKMK